MIDGGGDLGQLQMEGRQLIARNHWRLTRRDAFNETSYSNWIRLLIHFISEAFGFDSISFWVRLGSQRIFFLYLNFLPPPEIDSWLRVEYLHHLSDPIHSFRHGTLTHPVTQAHQLPAAVYLCYKTRLGSTAAAEALPLTYRLTCAQTRAACACMPSSVDRHPAPAVGK